MRKIIVNDKMQRNYKYLLQEPIGKNFDENFFPELSPMQMLQMGVFEGHYLNDCQNEFPAEWFLNAKMSSVPDVSYNYFGVKSRQPLSVWRQRGWIIGPDIRGWFQWYCRYYMGRRLPEIDRIQIKRWRSFRRHKVQIEQNCLPMDITCRVRQRQALLQWAYNPFF
ncbi:MAG: hypothetical protein IKY98_01645 [Alphaproteobacteria bacterium]|nr:hypothetical protein [Alphaproteobacteria bacterium]